MILNQRIYFFAACLIAFSGCALNEPSNGLPEFKPHSDVVVPVKISSKIQLSWQDSGQLDDIEYSRDLINSNGLFVSSDPFILPSNVPNNIVLKLILPIDRPIIDATATGKISNGGFEHLLNVDQLNSKMKRKIISS